MVTRAGSLASLDREPRQAREGAAVAVDAGAGVWLVRVTTLVPRPRTQASTVGDAVQEVGLHLARALDRHAATAFEQKVALEQHLR